MLTVSLHSAQEPTAPRHRGLSVWSRHQRWRIPRDIWEGGMCVHEYVCVHMCIWLCICVYTCICVYVCMCMGVVHINMWRPPSLFPTCVQKGWPRPVKTSGWPYLSCYKIQSWLRENIMTLPSTDRVCSGPLPTEPCSHSGLQGFSYHGAVSTFGSAGSSSLLSHTFIHTEVSQVSLAHLHHIGKTLRNCVFTLPLSWAQCHKDCAPSTRETKAGDLKFEASLGYIVKSKSVYITYRELALGN